MTSPPIAATRAAAGPATRSSEPPSVPLKAVAPELWQLGGLPPNAINVYLAGDVLIDAGTRQARRRILRQVIDRPLSLVCLTHVHPDHQGAAASVCEARGVPLSCHADDVDAMEGRRPMQSAHPDHPINTAIKSLWEGPPREVDRVLGGETRSVATGSSMPPDTQPER
jgi:hydroxyacylglutathione hydrolase